LPKQDKQSRFGEYIIEPVKELNVYSNIQRQAPAQRIKEIAGNWDEDRAGILLVALLTDGAHEGTYHVYDGGTRKQAAEMANGPDYEMPCWIREMTEQEAADQFLIFNKESKQPGQYDLYRIGLEADRPLMLAVQSAFNVHKLVGGTGTPTYGTPQEPGKVSALAKCMQIIGHWVDSGKSYQEASKMLSAILRVGRMAYPDSKDAHHGDLLQAIHRLYFVNETKLKQKANRDRLVERLQRNTLMGWQAKVNQVKATGGSDSRGNYLAYFIGSEYNKRWPEQKKLMIPRFEPQQQTVVVIGTSAQVEAA